MKTKYHGEISINERDIIQFNQGLPGFLEEKKFVILPLSDDGIYQILQSVKTPSLAFVITNPFHFFKDYEFDLDDHSLARLEIEAKTDIVVYSIVTIHEQFVQSTMNLQAPVIINGKKQIGKQFILTDTLYKTKHPFIKKEG